MENLIALFQSIEAAKVISPEIDYSEYVPLNLSITNSELQKYKLETAQDYEIFIQNHLDKNQGKIAFGGYIETRNLYQRSTVFKNTNSDERNIHIGLDLWIKAGTDVLAALDGKIHSFQNNTALGDYGPAIILEHEVDGLAFYTLYGHLSLKSLEGKFEGQVVQKGEIIAQLGAPPINGDYAPHLHFQIIEDLQGKKGDYPGVSSQKDLEYYTKNCPSPNILLKII